MSAPLLDTYAPRVKGAAPAGASISMRGNYGNAQVVAEGIAEFDVPAASVDIVVLPLQAGPLSFRNNSRATDIVWHPGELIFIPAGLPTWWAKHRAWPVLHIHMPPETLLGLSDHGHAASGKRLLVAEREPLVAELGRELVRMADASVFDTLHHDSLIVVLARRLSRLFDAAPRLVKGGLAPWQLRRVQARLTDDLNCNVGLDELAALVGLSPTYLCTAFRHSTGMPPHQWVKQQRIERAKALLEAGRASVTDIALEVGYSNPGHFATVFKAATGTSPLTWRRERSA